LVVRRDDPGEIPATTRARHLARELLSALTMRNPLLLTSAAAITCLALNACGGSNEPAKSPDDTERAADKAEEAADKAEDKADKAADKASDAASDAEKANETK
jgi:hypothetical protein